MLSRVLPRSEPRDRHRRRTWPQVTLVAMMRKVMATAMFQTEQWVDAPLDLTFGFFADPHNLDKISPPWSGALLLAARLIPPLAPLGHANATIESVAGVGSEIVVSFFLLPYIPVRSSWTARIVEFEWNRYFRDLQVKGPFKQFDHTHSFEQAERNGHSGTMIRDTIRYDLGLGGVGKLLNASLIKMQLAAMFRYRQWATERLLTRGMRDRS